MPLSPEKTRGPMRFGLAKSGLDAHTLGISSVFQLIEECGFMVYIADAKICEAVDQITSAQSFRIFKDWIIQNQITHIGFSYRLDPAQALEVFGKLVYKIQEDPELSAGKNGIIRMVYFAGLPQACETVEREFGKRYPTFRGDETPVETLKKIGIPEEFIPKTILENSVYDDLRLDFGKSLIREGKQESILPFQEYDYKHFGTARDHLIDRLNQARQLRKLPLMRVHAGPYLKDREKSLALFSEWLRKLAQSGYLDIVSVGSSQLSQSYFGEDWGDRPNGGGVPFNSAFELRAIREDASPMLARAYSATNNIPAVARVLEENLNMAWHALSLWWFNRIDGRGPLTVKQGLAQHLETIRYIASAGKPFEANTPHHFAFRGADDVAYIVSAYLAARTAKKLGIRHFVLQNMLNTPRSAWGFRDLAKSRALLKIVRDLEDDSFRVIYQPRAGLDYFSPDEEKAKIQLAAVTALMDDVEPENDQSPEIIHVVSYSEALFLATPDVIDESIRITKAALKNYPEFRKKNDIRDIILNREMSEDSEELREEARTMIADMEKQVEDLYSTDGLYRVFKMGYFPVPDLWEGREEFSNAVNWRTRIIDGSVRVVDENGKRLGMKDRLSLIHARNLS